MGTPAERLQQQGIKPSPQRVAILDFLMRHPIHPSVDTIFEALYPAMPTLSRTTVYNTLKLLAEKEAIRMLTIDDQRLRFDADVAPHAHFRCKGCRQVFDIPLRQGEVRVFDVPDGFRIDAVEFYGSGYCPACRSAGENDA